MKDTYPVSLGERLLSLFFPSRCLLCGSVVPVDTLFCEHCRDKLSQEPAVRHIALPNGKLLSVFSPMRYEGGFRETLHDFKFHGQKALAKPIAVLMAEAGEPHSPACDCVAYSPMHRADRRERGYDQSRLLAKHVAKLLGLPLEGLLEKNRRTQAQHDLDPKARQENPRGAYQAKEPASGKRVLLVDDIVTTGSTLRECALALYAAGAKDVCALCAADTPDTKG